MFAAGLLAALWRGDAETDAWALTGNRVAVIGLIGWLGWVAWIIAYSITLLTS